MADYRRHEILSGVFILAAVCVFGLFAFQVGGLEFGDLWPFKSETDLRCEAFFRDVKTLDVSAPVEVGGMRVGRVTSIEAVQASRLPDVWRRGGYKSDQREALIRVAFVIENTSLPLYLGKQPQVVEKGDAQVKLAMDGFLGTHYLSIEPGVWPKNEEPKPVRSQSLPDLVVLDVEAEAGFTALIDKAQPMFDEFTELIHRINDMAATLQTKVISKNNKVGIVGLMHDIRGGVGQARDILQEVQDLLNADRPDGLHQTVLFPLRDLLANVNQGVLEIRQDVLGKIVPEVQRVLKEGRAAVNDARGVIKQVKELVREDRPEVAHVLHQLASSSDTLDAVLKDFRTGMDRLLATSNGTLEENRADLREIVRRLRRSMWETEMLIRKIRANPAVLIWGDSEPLWNAREADRERERLSGRARPYGQRDEEGGK